MLKKKIWANFQRIVELFTQKIVTKLSKIWVWDPGKPIPDPGSRGQKGTGSRIRNSCPSPFHSVSLLPIRHCILRSLPALRPNLCTVFLLTFEFPCSRYALLPSGTVFYQCCGPGMFMRIRDVYLDPGSEFFLSRISIKEFKCFNPKYWFLNSAL
jgi:hypothetical protein